MPPASARRAAVHRPPVLLILRGHTLVRCVPAELLAHVHLCERQDQSVYTLDKAALDLDRAAAPGTHPGQLVASRHPPLRILCSALLLQS